MMKLFCLICVAFFAGSIQAQTLVRMQTSQGTIVLELNDEKAPQTARNFIRYVQEGFYNGTLFHRVINGFMIQGGGFDAQMNQKNTRAPIENEAANGLKNERGTLAMARTNDPHSATSQFFINLVDNPSLDYPSFDGWGYCVFGKVVEGMDVVDQIAQIPTNTKQGHQNVPQIPVVIEKTSIVAPQS